MVVWGGGSQPPPSESDAARRSRAERGRGPPSRRPTTLSTRPQGVSGWVPVQPTLGSGVSGVTPLQAPIRPPGVRVTLPTGAAKRRGPTWRAGVRVPSTSKRQRTRSFRRAPSAATAMAAAPRARRSRAMPPPRPRLEEAGWGGAWGGTVRPRGAPNERGVAGAGSWRERRGPGERTARAGSSRTSGGGGAGRGLDLKPAVRCRCPPPSTTHVMTHPTPANAFALQILSFEKSPGVAFALTLDSARWPPRPFLLLLVSSTP